MRPVQNGVHPLAALPHEVPDRRERSMLCAASGSTQTFAIIVRLTPFASLGNAYRHKNNKRSKSLLSDAGLHHNWHIDKRSLRYLAAFARAWQIHIADK